MCPCFFFSRRRRHTRFHCDWSSDVCSPISEIRNLRTDIGNFGGNPTNVSLYDPPATISRGITSMDRVIVAENALKVARDMGGDLIAGTELEQAEQTLKTARALAKNDKQSKSADHLAYIAEMQARRAEYLARRNGVTSHLASLRAERTRLARSEEHTSELQSQSNLVCRLLLE